MASNLLNNEYNVEFVLFVLYLVPFLDTVKKIEINVVFHSRSAVAILVILIARRIESMYHSRSSNP